MNEQTTLRIRGMVCDRCVSVVRRELEGLGISVLRTRLGLVTVEGTLSAEQLALVRSMLEAEGFSLLNDRKAALLQNVKDFINGFIESGELAERNQRLSDRLAERFAVDYPTLSALFSSTEGITLEKYTISQRLDKVRELLVYSDLPVADIAYQTGFGTVQHLSNQFKRETGLTPAFYRRIRREKERLQHDSVVTASA
jgi:AraC-like DNA-binding protein